MTRRQRREELRASFAGRTRTRRRAQIRRDLAVEALPPAPAPRAGTRTMRRTLRDYLKLDR